MNPGREQERTIGIIADDLTSAADGAGPFVGAGHRALVMIVVGSANPVSHGQMAGLSDMADVQVMTVPTARAPDPSAVLNELVTRFRLQFDTFGPDALIATGGETMGALLQSLSVTGFRLLGEVSPGFPYGRARLPGRPRPLLIGLKAGGFGDPDALQHAAGFFQRGQS